MSERQTKIIDGTIQVPGFMQALNAKILKGLETGAVAVDLYRPEEDRSQLQNEKSHAMIGDIAKQAVFKTPGLTVKMSSYDFDEAKALLVAWFERECIQLLEPLRHGSRVVIDPFTGENITIRASTAKFLKKENINFIEWLYSVGADGGVKWSEKALACYNEYREAQQ